MSINSGGLAASKAAKEGKLGKEAQGKGTAGGEGGVGTKALTKGLQAQQKRSFDAGVLSNIGAGPLGKNALGTPTGDPSRAVRPTEGGSGGGTTVTDKYVPGATDVYPDADGLTVVEKVIAPLAPGAGAVLGAYGAYKAVTDPAAEQDTLLGGNPGLRRGYQPDRYRGAASLGGIGGSGGAVNGGDDPEIAGEPIRAVTKDPDGDSSAPPAHVTDIYSDVMLQDRRKPGLKQMLEAML